MIHRCCFNSHSNFDITDGKDVRGHFVPPLATVDVDSPHRVLHKDTMNS